MAVRPARCLGISPLSNLAMEKYASTQVRGTAWDRISIGGIWS